MFGQLMHSWKRARLKRKNLLQKAEKRAEKERKKIEKRMGALTIGMFPLACTK